MKSDPLVKINELIEQDYLIVVDTNVLLGLYRLSPDYADFALKCLEKTFYKKSDYPHKYCIF